MYMLEDELQFKCEDEEPCLLQWRSCVLCPSILPHSARTVVASSHRYSHMLDILLQQWLAHQSPKTLYATRFNRIINSMLMRPATVRLDLCSCVTMQIIIVTEIKVGLAKAGSMHKQSLRGPGRHWKFGCA